MHYLYKLFPPLIYLLKIISKSSIFENYRCDYVWLSEPPYEDVSGTPFCDLYSLISYRSNTRTLSITLLYSQSYNHAFTLEYTAESMFRFLDTILYNQVEKLLFKLTQLLYMSHQETDYILRVEICL